MRKKRKDQKGRRDGRSPLSQKIRHDLIGKLVNRFLAWPLPESVCSDLCVTRQGDKHRSGTNLLTEGEARQMFEYVFDKPSR